jgi:two-component system phosphate regulon sensor histidine kinase PhoR
MKSELSNSLLAAVPLPLILIGADDCIQGMNPGAQLLFPGAGVGRHYVTALRQPALLSAIDRAQTRRETTSDRYLEKTTTREAMYKVSVSPVGSALERGVLVAFEDITELERAGEIRRDFVANVSHELKTPLTALLGFIETLRGAARDDPEARDRFLTIMDREASRMNRLVSDLLSLSRVESAERQRPIDRVDLLDLAESTVAMLQPLASAQDVVLSIEQQGGGDYIVPGAADQLQQVLSNLVENAIKYGNAGGRVVIRLERHERELAFRGPGIAIEVADFGAGFDPHHISRLTERFYRVDSHRSREMGGTGLGLAIAKHIVNRHRGRFRIDSTPGQGATFTVLIPAMP